jgi:hypothetical protein
MTKSFGGWAKRDTNFELRVKCNTQARMQHNRKISVQTSQHQISEKYGKKHRIWRLGLPLYFHSNIICEITYTIHKSLPPELQEITKIPVFWNMTPFTLVYSYQCVLHPSLHHPGSVKSACINLQGDRYRKLKRSQEKIRWWQQN